MYIPEDKLQSLNQQIESNLATPSTTKIAQLKKVVSLQQLSEIQMRRGPHDYPPSNNQ